MGKVRSPDSLPKQVNQSLWKQPEGVKEELPLSERLVALKGHILNSPYCLPSPYFRSCNLNALGAQL